VITPADDRRAIHCVLHDPTADNLTVPSKVMPQIDHWHFTLATACDAYRAIKTCPAPGKIVVDVDLLVLSPASETAQHE
jgi:hypothetical protein